MGVDNVVTVEIGGFAVTMEWPQGGPQRLTAEPVDPDIHLLAESRLRRFAP
jgi:hypothetical protein